MAKRDPLDTLFSEFIRKRALIRVGGCERCLTPKYDTTREDGSTYPAFMHLEASHYIGRTTKCVRWDEDNAVGLCAGCHMHLEHHPDEHREWFANKLGQEAPELLRGRQRIRQRPDRAALFLYYKHKIQELNRNPVITTP